MLVDAAISAAKTKGSYLKDKHHRLKARRGGLRAALAIAHRIFVSAYHMLSKNLPYRDLGEAYLDQNGAGVLWSTGPNGEPTYANQRLLDYTGRRLEDFKNRNWERFLHPDDLQEFVKAVDHAIQTGASYEAVHRLRRSNANIVGITLAVSRCATNRGRSFSVC